MPFSNFTVDFLLAAILAVAGLAFWKGQTPERIGAGVNALAAVFFVLAQKMMSGQVLATTWLALDGVIALTFLVLTVRFAALWLGAAMLLQAAQFALHAFYYVVERPHDFLFAVVNNVASWGVLLAIVGGVLASWSAERRNGGRLAAGH
jgi:hypothetical protein